MTVAYETILLKTEKEIQLAQHEQTNHIAMVRHVANIKLLCELILEEETSPSDDKPSSNGEMAAMIRGGTLKQPISGKEPEKHAKIDHDQANGNSIFDF